MSEWIDINNDLPEPNTNVLVRYHAHYDDEEINEFDCCTAFYSNDKFDVKDQHFYKRRKTIVTHWMLIPQAMESDR